MGKSNLEALFDQQVKAYGLVTPVAEMPFHPTRKWRLDRAWPEYRLAVEIEGGVWTQGRHTRGAGFEADADKYAEAALAGWLVLRVTGKQVQSGYAVRTVAKLLEQRRVA